MADDTAALQERLARRLHELDPIGGHAPTWRRLSETDRDWYRHKARGLDDIIAAEVQAAKAEAWDEGRLTGATAIHPHYQPNPYRATETGAEHDDDR